MMDIDNPADEFLARYIEENAGVLRPEDIDEKTGLPKMQLEKQTAGLGSDDED